MTVRNRFAPRIDFMGFPGDNEPKEKYQIYKKYFAPQTAPAARLFTGGAGTGLKLT